MITGKPLDELYFEWLYGQIGSLRNRDPRRSHMRLCAHLYQTEFRYFVPNDDNRAMDGIDLRDEFLSLHPEVEDEHLAEWIEMECSILEMIFALSRRADFMTDPDQMVGGTAGWFRHFLQNLGLDGLTDNKFNDRSLEAVDIIIDKLNNRTYNKNGEGGLFPMPDIRRDQRKVELWYQLNKYLEYHRYIQI